MTKGIAVLVVVLFGIACNNNSKSKDADKAANHDSVEMVKQIPDSVHTYTPAMVDIKKDLVCGMPVTAGISDTAHYKGKAYGFCSKECKDDFVKNPEQYLAAK